MVRRGFLRFYTEVYARRVSLAVDEVLQQGQVRAGLQRFIWLTSIEGLQKIYDSANGRAEPRGAEIICRNRTLFQQTWCINPDNGMVSQLHSSIQRSESLCESFASIG